MALPALSALRSAYPAGRLAVACRPQLSACFSADPAVSEVIPCPASGGLKSLPQLWRDGGTLRARGFDSGVLLTNSFSTALWLWRAAPPLRLGYDRDGRGLLLTDAVPVTDGLAAAHMTDYYLHLAARLGANPGPGVPPPGAGTEPVLPKLHVPKEGHTEAEALLQALKLPGRFALFSPASAYGPVKDWPEERYAETARRLYEDAGLVSLISGSAAQEGICARIAALAGDAAANVASRTSLAGLMALAARAALFLGGDSGGAHVAAAVGTPTAVIFGITEPSRTRQLGPQVKLLGAGGEFTPDLDNPATRERARAALAAVTVNDVLETARGLLEAKRKEIIPRPGEAWSNCC